MAHPTTKGTASAAAKPQAQVYLSTSCITTPVKAKTQTHPPVSFLSSTSHSKFQNVADKTIPASSNRSSTCAASSDVKTSGNAVIAGVKKQATGASFMDRSIRAQEEARRLQLTLAQQQVQQYQAMTKQLEAQSGIAMNPCSTVNKSTAMSSKLTTSIAGLTKTSENLQKLRQEQLVKLQQNAQRQATMAAQAMKKRANEEWFRKKLLMEQEHRKLLRAHEQQPSQTSKGNATMTTTPTSITDSLLVQQQHVIRQQQMLRDMLQKQQQAQMQLQLRLKKGTDSTVANTQAAAISKIVAKPSIATGPTYYSVKKKQMKDVFDMELEGLARVCIRVANARTDSEMRQALEKMTSWLNRCTDLLLLQIAQRDYRDSIAHRRPMLVQQNRWPLDLQVKSDCVTQKIVQMLEAFLLREKNKAAQQAGAVKCADAVTCAATSVSVTNASAKSTTSSSTTTTAITGSAATARVATSAVTTGSAGNLTSVGTIASRTSSTIAGATTTTTVIPKQQAVVAPTTTTSATTSLSPSTTAIVQSMKTPVNRDMAAIEREYADLKAQLQAKQVEINQKAKTKRDAAKLEAGKALGVISNRETTASMLAATHKRPLQVVKAPAFVKKQRADACVLPSSSLTTDHRPSTPSVSPISLRVAQQFYDLDLTARTSSECEDKMYMPLKIVSKIMYKALPGACDKDTAAGGGSYKREEQAKGRSLLSSISPSSSTQNHESRSEDTVSISDEAVTFMQECVTEFLLYFTSEARDLSVMQNRRTKKGVGLSISGSNVVKSMENLGFTPYAHVLAEYNKKVKASQDAAVRKKMERKRLIQQQTMQKATAAAAASKNAVLPPAYAHATIKPTSSLPLANTVAMSKLMPTRTGVVGTEMPRRTEIATAKPIVPVTTIPPPGPGKPAMKTMIAVSTSNAAPTTKSL